MPKPPKHRPGRRLACLLALTAAVGGSGCAGPLSRWRTAHDSSIAKPITREEVGDGRSLMARWLDPGGAPNASPKSAASLVQGREGFGLPTFKPDPVADAEFRAAEVLFQKGRFREAETAFARIARRRKDTPWGEKAQYHLAECQYQRGNFVGAHDSFETLFAVYPGTDYLDKAVRREYEIGQAWLAAADPKANPDDKAPWDARLTGRLPLADTNGNALAVLEHVRHHSAPTNGPLADDAVKRIADYHRDNQDYEMAAVHYDQLIESHPKSPFVREAQIQGIDARIKDYRGPDYDRSGLEEARKLVRQTMVSFPEQAENRDKLLKTLDLINDQDAEHTYRTGDYYLRTGKVISAEHEFGKVIQLWPDSPWAEKARPQLAKLAKMPRKTTLPSKILTQPGSADPYTGGGGGGGSGAGANGGGGGLGGLGGMGAGSGSPNGGS